MLPPELFDYSIFGRSMIANYNTTEHTPSELKVKNFRNMGFPTGFCNVLEHGLPLLLGANPTRRCVPNHATADALENYDFVKSTLQKWESMGVLRYVSY